MSSPFSKNRLNVSGTEVPETDPDKLPFGSLSGIIFCICVSEMTSSYSGSCITHQLRSLKTDCDCRFA